MSEGAIPPTHAGASRPSAPAPQVVQILSLPDALQSVSRAVRLEGEVTHQNRDGSVRVRTPQGDIDIQVRGRQPQEGQRVEIDLPAGQPPRSASIRNAPPAPPPQTAQPQPPPTGTSPPPSAPPPQTTPPPAVTVDVSAQPRPAAPQATPPPVPGTPPPASTPESPVSQTNLPRPVASPPPQVDIKLIGNNQSSTKLPQARALTPAQAKPVLSALPLTLLPQLSSGQTVRLVPLLSAAMTGTQNPAMETGGAAPNIPAPTTTTPQAGGMLNGLLQSVKAAMPSLGVLTGMIPAPAQQAGIMPPLASAPAQIIPPAILSATITGTTLPGQTIFNPITSSASPPPSAAATPVTATITGYTPQQQPIVTLPSPPDASAPKNPAMPQNQFILQVAPSATPIPTGSAVTLVPQLPAAIATINPATQIVLAAPGTPVQGAPVQAMPPAWRTLLPLMQPATLWPAMDDLFQTFYQTTPQAAQILGRIIPSPANAASLGPALILFAAAARSGDLQSWIGDKKFDMLQKLGKGQLAARLGAETSALTRSAETSQTDWKSFPIPMLWQNEISKVMFHVRREPRDDDTQETGMGTRFVFDLDLTRMGEVQLDGYLRGERLDLIVRTKEPVSLSMQDAMKRAYADALDGTNIYGELGFQGAFEQWLRVNAKEESLKIST